MQQHDDDDGDVDHDEASSMYPKDVGFGISRYPAGETHFSSSDKTFLSLSLVSLISSTRWQLRFLYSRSRKNHGECDGLCVLVNSFTMHILPQFHHFVFWFMQGSRFFSFVDQSVHKYISRLVADKF